MGSLNVVLTSTIADMSASGSSSPDGRCFFVSPIAGKIEFLHIAQSAVPDAAQDITISSEIAGQVKIGEVPNGRSVSLPVTLETQMFDRANFVRAGEAFVILTNGVSTVASAAGVTVEIRPA